jgi:hypothetical protein
MRSLQVFICLFAFPAIHTPLHFYWFIMSCCVFVSQISPEMLAFFAHLFSFHGICCVFPCSFKFLCFLEYWHIFLRYYAWKSFSIYVLGGYWYIHAIWIAIFAFVILAHPIDSYHNTIYFLELIGTNISLWCYFWIDFCLIFSGICRLATPVRYLTNGSFGK